VKEMKKRTNISPSGSAPKKSDKEVSGETKQKEISEALSSLQSAKEISKKFPKKAIKLALQSGSYFLFDSYSFRKE
jgi:hypothetical protein